MQNSKQDQGNAQTAFGGAQAGLSDYENRVNQFIAADPYKAGGDYQQAMNTIIGSRASADSNALGNELALSAQRSGENSANYAPTLAKATRDSTLDAQTAQAQALADRLNKETAYQGTAVDMSKFPVQANEGLYGSSLSGANASLGTAGSAAANNKSFGDTFGQAFAGSLGSGLGGLLTGKGATYNSADGFAFNGGGGGGGGISYG